MQESCCLTARRADDVTHALGRLISSSSRSCLAKSLNSINPIKPINPINPKGFGAEVGSRKVPTETNGRVPGSGATNLLLLGAWGFGFIRVYRGL